MKRIACLALCLVMALFCVNAGAAQYTLPEKMMRQMNFGSGLKGSLQLTVSGEGELAKLLAPLSGADIELRAIRSDKLFQDQLYVLSGEEQQGLTQVYGDDDTLRVRSALLPDTLLTMQTGGDPVGRLLGGGEGNPAWYSAALSLLAVPDATWEETWVPAITPYETAVELWLKAYGAAPSVVHDATGDTLMMIRYEIPASAVKSELTSLLTQALADETLLTLLKEQLTEEQQATYLNPALLSYYAQVVDALPLTGSITLEREMTTMGEARRTTLSFPLPENDGGFTAFQLEQDSADLTFTLDGAEKTVALVMKSSSSSAEGASWSGILRVLPGADAKDQKPLSAAFKLSKTETSRVDDDTREHVITTWQLEAEPDLSHLTADDPTRADYLDFGTVKAEGSIHFHSKNADSSPTTLEITGSLTMQDLQASLTCTLKTTSPWVLEDLPTEGGEDLLTLTDERKTELLTTFASNALAMLSAMQPSALPLPDEVATPSSLSGQ